MRIAKTVSITLPPALLVEAQQIAQRENRTMSELFREALRRYIVPKTIERQQRWTELLERTRAHGNAIGVTTEEDVERLSDEYRAEKRRGVA
jgi:predicted transcriptional regulator